MLVVGTVCICGLVFSGLVGVSRKLLKEIDAKWLNKRGQFEELPLEVDPSSRRLVSGLLDDFEIDLRRVRRLPPGPKQSDAAAHLRQQYDPQEQLQHLGKHAQVIYQRVYSHVLQRTLPFLEASAHGDYRACQQQDQDQQQVFCQQQDQVPHGCDIVAAAAC